MSELEQLRGDIDAIDRQIVDLMKQRMETVAQVAEYKKANNIPVLDSGRERALLSKVGQEAGEELADYIQSMYRTIMAASRSYENGKLGRGSKVYDGIKKAMEETPQLFPQRPTVACQGIEGAYSQIACDRLFKAPSILYFQSFDHVFKAVESGMCQYGILPIENSTAGSVMFLLTVGSLLEEWTRKKSLDDLARSMALNVDKVWVRTPQGEVLVPLTRVHAGDEVVVRSGNMIPLDGMVLEGEAMVNQAALTGESMPVRKTTGATVYAGTVVEEGECVLVAKAEGGANRYDKIVAMIEESEKLKSGTENRALQLADRLVPWCLAGTVATYAFTRNVTRAISILMVDFSCALKLSMPLAVLSAMRECGEYHITVKGGKYLEALAKADTIVFDKTGTLTRATPQVVQVVPFSGCGEQEVLQLAACLEEHFPHSMANAVVRAAKERGISHEEMHSEVEYIVAHGIASRVGGKRVVIGSAHFIFEDEGCTIPAEEQAKFDGLDPQYSHLYLAASGVLVGVICIADPLRPEAAQVLRQLQKLGITQTVMMTGDSDRTARAIAAQVGVDRCFAEVLPEDKAAFVRNAKAEGHTVVMIGDGINDSPALSAADIGIAIHSGAAIAREIADVTIRADSLEELVTLKAIANALQKRVGSNYRFVLSFNSALILLGALGILPPATSAMLHNLSTLGISLRSMTDLLEQKSSL